MSEAPTVDFFDRLEAELRAAAQRPRRRVPDLRAPATLAAVAVAIALALVPAIAILGSGERSRTERPAVHQLRPQPYPVGSTVQRGGERHRVVATGVAPVAGPWQMEAYSSTRIADPETGEEYQPAGLRCLGLSLVDPRPGDRDAAVPTGMAPVAGQCGEFPGTPGFSRIQLAAPATKGDAREVLVYGRAPEAATAVVLTGAGGREWRVKPLEGPRPADGDFYLFAVPPGVTGRVNWLDADGAPGSRGIELLPP